jgi:hypothetical protein
MKPNPLSNSKPSINIEQRAKVSRFWKLASSLTTTCALILALNYFPNLAEAGTMPQTDGTPLQVAKNSDAHGYLKVYSKTRAGSPAEEVPFNFHTAYWIYDKNGERIQTVRNHGSYPDEGPDTVELATGKYIVEAWAEGKGLVKVPVVIKRELTTSLHLED